MAGEMAERFFAALRMTGGHGRGDGGKILRCAQNDRGSWQGRWRERFFAALRMTGGHGGGDGGKILRCAQNDM